VTALGAGPKRELWPHWNEHDRSSTTVIDHRAWGQFLDKDLVHDHPTGVALVRYTAVSRQDAALLKDYWALNDLK
jgi:hypothetical protein